MSVPDPPTTEMMLALMAAAALPGMLAAWLLRRESRHWPVVVLLGLAALGFGVAFDKFLPDDSYITYRYAHNLLEGRGLVYNPGERVLSTTTPLYTLLLAAWGLAWPDLPSTSHALSVAALFGGALMMCLLCSRHLRTLPGLVLALLYILSPLTVAVFSSESLLHVLLIWGALYAYDRGSLGWAAFCSGLAVVNRADGALLGLALGLHWLLAGGLSGASLKERLGGLLGKARSGMGGGAGVWRAAGIYAAVALPWYAFSWWYYGTPAPATLAAKVAQSSVPGTTPFAEGLGFWWRAYSAHSPFYWLLPPLALLGLLMVLSRRGERWAMPAMLWAGLYTAGYSLLAVPRYQNYYTPIVPALLLLAVLGMYRAGEALHALSARLGPRSRWSSGAVAQAIAVGVPGLLLLLAFWASEAGVFGRLPQARAVLYEEIGHWLRESTPPGSTVGMLEVGTIGYYAERHVIDFYGLIQPEVASHLARNDQTWAVRHYRPDYVVALPWLLPIWGTVDGSIGEWFAGHYEPVKEFRNERFSTEPVVVYKRKAAP